jgi:hypothetical protein
LGKNGDFHRKWGKNQRLVVHPGRFGNHSEGFGEHPGRSGNYPGRSGNHSEGSRNYPGKIRGAASSPGDFSAAVAEGEPGRFDGIAGGGAAGRNGIDEALADISVPPQQAEVKDIQAQLGGLVQALRH